MADGSVPAVIVSPTPNEGDNNIIDGPYWVYRSVDPFFGPDDELYPISPGAPISDGVTCYLDDMVGAGVYYYKVWNYMLDDNPPRVDAVVPASGAPDSGQAIIVYGDYFQDGASITICDDPATNESWVSGQAINAHVPVYADCAATPCGSCPCACDVTVTNPNNQQGTLVGGFTYN